MFPGTIANFTICSIRAILNSISSNAFQPFCAYRSLGTAKGSDRKYPMTSKRPTQCNLVLAFACTLLLLGCEVKSPTDETSVKEETQLVDRLNGAWVSGVQSGPSHVYITELRFNNGLFEWTWDEDLQQRGIYDTLNGILTVTIQHNYGSPQRSLGDYSRAYSVVGNTLTWGGTKFTKK
jgi:hypothetical protein